MAEERHRMRQCQAHDLDFQKETQAASKGLQCTNFFLSLTSRRVELSASVCCEVCRLLKSTHRFPPPAKQLMLWLLVLNTHFTFPSMPVIPHQAS